MFARVTSLGVIVLMLCAAVAEAQPPAGQPENAGQQEGARRGQPDPAGGRAGQGRRGGGRRGGQRGGRRGGPVTLNQQPATSALAQSVQAQSQAATLDDAARARVDEMVAQAQVLLDNNQEGPAREILAEAQAVILGQEWSAQDAFLWSLDIKPSNIVMDAGLPIRVQIAQHYATPDFTIPASVRLHVTLTPAGGGEAIEVGDVPLSGQWPQTAEATSDAIQDGYYQLQVELKNGDETPISMSQQVALFKGIESNKANLDERLAKIEGHDSAKWTVRWPYDMARVINEGVRSMNSDDFGLGVDGSRDFLFAKEMAESTAVLEALERGENPLVRAKGDNERHYWFEEAGEIMPYRVYVPTTWDGQSQLPMVYVLHGNTRDHDFYFDRDDGTLWKEAEKHGYLVATCMGYRPSIGYNAGGGGGGGRRGGQAPSGPSRGELSEMDAMNAFKLIVDEYNPDPKNIYVFAHSSGATGGWYLGEKHIDLWAGLALSAATTRPDQVDFTKFANTPMMMIVGTQDAANRVQMVDVMFDALQEAGVESVYQKIEGADHDTVVGQALPGAFEFFNRIRAEKQTPTP
jgi:pimeloyl-ACP methyl ester carboxylesterase